MYDWDLPFTRLTWYSFEDTYQATMAVNTENYRTNPGTETVSFRMSSKRWKLLNTNMN